VKVEVVPSYHDPEQFTVRISHGVQSFRLDYTETKAQCQWMAKMFRKALKAHDKEMARRENHQDGIIGIR
jgi:hypothetical protein